MYLVISLRSIPHGPGSLTAHVRGHLAALDSSRPDLTLIVHLSASGAACFPHPATIAGDPTHP
jgi:hypothetical protein